MSNAKTHQLQPDLAPKKSTLIKGVIHKDINGNLYIKTSKQYVYLMQDDQDYLRIQSIDALGKEVEAYLSETTYNGKVIIKAKLKTIKI